MTHASITSVLPVILSGGSGTRLWPSSRAERPKQFVELIDKRSLFELTLERVTEMTHSPVVVCNEVHRFLVADQMLASGFEKASILLEPVARNTTAAIALAACDARARGINDPMLICPSDHLIDDIDAFRQVVSQAAEIAMQGTLVTFGIKPSAPETGYGYIRATADGVSDVQQFVEKPDRETAQQFLDSDELYYWNSGIFMFTAESFLQELGLRKPELLRFVQAAYDERVNDLDFQRIAEKPFSACENISVDYAVMEHSDKVKVVPFNGAWSDLGSWASVHEASDKDDNGNAVSGDTCLVDTRNSYVKSQSRLVSVLGCDDIAVIETPDAVAVLNLAHSQDVKSLVTALSSSERDEVTDHSRVFRPWGNYESLDNGNRYQVKRLVVKPGARLSLQKHHHRAEHWVVVRGTAKITRGDEEFMLAENQSTYIPLGEMHRLENPGSIDLELIEVQSGSYLGEDDIVRVDDKYGRIRAIDSARKSPDKQNPDKTEWLEEPAL